MMEFGTEKTTSIVGNTIISEIRKYYMGEVAKSLRNHRIKVKVINAQDEMKEFIQFTDELNKLRQQGKLAVDKDDATTYPAFIIQYPKEDLNGTYFIIKSYTIVI